MKAAEARAFLGQEVMLFRASRPGCPPLRVRILEVVGRNVEYDHYGMSSWEWLPDVSMAPLPEGQADG